MVWRICSITGASPVHPTIVSKTAREDARRSAWHLLRTEDRKKVTGSVAFLVLDFALLLEKLTLKRFALSVFNRRGFLIVFALLPLANDPFFLDHSLEALNSTFEILVVIYSDVRD